MDIKDLDKVNDLAAKLYNALDRVDYLQGYDNSSVQVKFGWRRSSSLTMDVPTEALLKLCAEEADRLVEELVALGVSATDTSSADQE